MEFVEQLKSSVDIVRVIGEYVPSLKRVGGTGRYVGLCPFHNEKTASFSVHATHQFYKCFGCGVGGDVIKFVMEIESLSFYEALTLLAERNGIPMPKRSEHADEESKKRARLVEMQQIACEHFQANLSGPGGAQARAYLEQRGVRPEVAREFQLGLSDRGGRTLLAALQRRGFSESEMEDAGLVLRREDGSGCYDRFRGRLMFPIHNESAKPIGFGGRSMSEGEEPKYLNTAKTEIYDKSRVLYNLHRAKEGIRKNARSILVEGYMDVIGVYSAGFKEVVASCGTALTSFQVRALKRHGEHIVVNFDSDKAGANATEKSIQMLLEEGMRLKVLQLEGGKDPDEFIREQGAAAYEQSLANARGYFHWLADRARTKFDVRTPEGRVEGFQFLLPAIHKMPDKLDRLAVANDVAEYLGVAQGMVLDEFRRAAAERREQRPQKREGLAVPPNERILIRALMTSPETREQLLAEMEEMNVIARLATRRIFEAIFSASKKRLDFTFADVEGRLSEPDKALLAALLMADEDQEDTVSVQQAAESVRTLRAQEARGERDEMRTRIKAAEKSGDLKEALRLAGELGRLERSGESGR